MLFISTLSVFNVYTTLMLIDPLHSPLLPGHGELFRTSFQTSTYRCICSITLLFDLSPSLFAAVCRYHRHSPI